MDDLTLGHLWSVIRKLKISAIVGVLTFLGSVAGTAFALGRITQEHRTAMNLQTPFSMRLKLEAGNQDFEHLILIKDPTSTPPSPDTEVLTVREIRNEFDVVPIGVVIAQTDHTQVSWPWSWLAQVTSLSKAWAAEGFDWHGHRNDYNYTEKFVDADTVNRTYTDGCVLEYKVTKSRSSNPSSFRWIKNVHG